MKKFITVFICIVLISLQIPIYSFAEDVTTRINDDYTFNDGDTYSASGIGRDHDITIKVNGTVTIKKRQVITGNVTIEGIGDDARIVCDPSLSYIESSHFICVANGGGTLALKNVEIVGNPAASGPTVRLGGSDNFGNLIIGENTKINAGGENKIAIGVDDPDEANKITIAKTATITGTIPEGVNDLRNSGSDGLTLSSEITATPDSVQTGDVVTVTGILKPSEAADLTSGSMEMHFDNSIFTMKDVSPGEALSTLDKDKVHINSDENSVKVLFTGLDSSINVGKDGIVMFKAEFVANQTTESPAVFSITEIEGSKSGNTNDLAIDENYPSVEVAVTKPVATCEPFGSDYYIVKYGADAEPAEGNAFFLNGQEMTYVPAYSKLEEFAGKKVYVLLTTSIPENLVPEELPSSQTARVIDPATGDANMNGKTNVVDAQVAYYMLSGGVNSTTEGLDWLNADVNGDSEITALDYKAIQYYVLYGVFGQFE